MAHLEQLKQAGVFEEYNGLVQKFLKVGSDAATVRELNEAVDKNGVKSNQTMKLLGILQRQGKLHPGLWKELVNLNSRLEGAKPAAASSPAATTGEQQAMSNQQPVATPATTPPTDNVVSLDTNLSNKEEDRLKQFLQKQEEVNRKRMFEAEKRYRDRLKSNLEKRAQRQGLKIEEAAEITQARDAIKSLREAYKTKVAELKTIREDVKKNNEVIKTVRAKQRQAAGGAKAPAQKTA